MQSIWLVHLATSWFLTGLIWVIQVVHYALFDKVGASTWQAYHHAHTVRISLIVVPLMLLELFSCLALVLLPSPILARWEALSLGLLTLIIWVSTFAIQVPLHSKLAAAHPPSMEAIQALVKSNWIRTIAWSLKFGLGFWVEWRR